MADKKSYGYGKRPLWQWILLYVVIGIVVYGIAYYFFFAPKGGYSTNQSQNYSNPAPATNSNPTTNSGSGY